MSDLQDLIHKTSMDCLAKGRQQEQERIVKVLEELVSQIESDYCCAEDDGNRILGIAESIALIKGDK